MKVYYIDRNMLKLRENVTKQNKKCDLIEQLDATNQTNLIHAQIRKTIGAHKGNATTCIEDKDGNIIMHQDHIRTRLFEYISELYKEMVEDNYDTCLIENKIPTIWRQSKIIAILKLGKESAIPKNYRPISLLCHTYKLYERLILNMVSPLLEQHLIKEQAGFRPGKSCTSQLLNTSLSISKMVTREARLPVQLV